MTYQVIFFFDGNEDDAIAVKKYLVDAVYDGLEIKRSYGVVVDECPEDE